MAAYSAHVDDVQVEYHETQTYTHTHVPIHYPWSLIFCTYIHRDVHICIVQIIADKQNVQSMSEHMSTHLFNSIQLLYL